MKNLFLTIEKIAKNLEIVADFAIFSNTDTTVYHVFLPYDDKHLVYFMFKNNSIYDIDGEHLYFEEYYSQIVYDRLFLAGELLYNFLEFNKFYLKNEEFDLIDFPIDYAGKLSDEIFDHAISYDDSSRAFSLINSHISRESVNSELYKMRSSLLLKNSLSHRAIKDLIFSFFLDPTNFNNVFDVYFNFASIYKSFDAKLALKYILQLSIKIENVFKQKEIDVFTFERTAFGFDDTCFEEEMIERVVQFYKLILIEKANILSIKGDYEQSNEVLNVLYKMNNDIKYLYSMAVNLHEMGDSKLARRLFTEVINFKNGIYLNIGVDHSVIEKARRFLKG